MEQGGSTVIRRIARRSRWAGLLLGLGAGTAAAAIHTWVDAQGRRHFADRPPAGIDVRTLPPTSSTRPAPVAKVIDGDTVRLQTGETLRLIGIDTPELPFRGRPGEPGAEAARDRLAALLDDSTRMRLGETPEDRYQRRLVYLQTDTVADIAEVLLQEGHARVSLHEDNAQRADRYFAAEADARRHNRGLWSQPDWQPRPATDAAGWRNRFGTFQGRVTAVRVTEAGGRITLDDQLDLWITPAALDRFDRARLQSALGQRAAVRGMVRQRDGRPYLPLQHPGQWDTLPAP